MKKTKFMDLWWVQIRSVNASDNGIEQYLLYKSYIRIIYVTRLGKTNHVGTTSEMHFIVPYHRYNTLSKHNDNITRGGQVCFSTQLFLCHANHWKASTDGEAPLGGFNRMAWTLIVSYTLASSSAVVCDWCGGLFGIWPGPGVPLSVFFLTEDL